MTTSLYMPDVVVELGFGYGYATPVDDIVWTDVSEYVELAESITIGFGRGDERSTADANSVSLTLDNSDGRFTARRAASPYYPNVKLGVPMRVTATPVGGTASTRFVGYVDEWPLAWDGTDEYAVAAISATSRLSRLGITTTLRSVVEESVLADSPVVYYTLGEPEGSTSAADSSGNGGQSLAVDGDATSPVVFGSAIGPGTDDLTAATFHDVTVGPSVYSGQTLARPTPVTAFPITIEAFFLATNLGGYIINTSVARLGVSAATGKLLGNGSLSSPGAVNDGLTHHAALTISGGGTQTLYLDGAVVGSGATSIGADFGMRVGEYLNGTLAHIAVFDRELAADRIAAHAASGLTGFVGETTDERLARYASFVGIDAADVVAESGKPMAVVDTTGASAVDMMRVCETTEQGVLYDTRSGLLGFQNRGHRYAAATAFAFDFNRQEIESGYQPVLDRSTLLNEVTGSNVGGTVTGIARNQASIDDNGLAATSVEIATTDPADPQRIAAWWVARYADPQPRVAALSVNLLPFAAADQDTILALTIGDLIAVTNHPAQAAETTAAYFVEGVSEDIGAESYMLTFNLSPAEPYTSVLILNDPVRGLPNGSNVLGF